MAKKVLLCDDEFHILRAAQIKVARAGYDVRTAHDGEEGWELIQQELPDILVTDLQMPRLDGIGLSRRIRENPATCHLPILMLTAKGFEPTHRDMAAEWGVLAVLCKPFSAGELVRHIGTILETGAIQLTA
jgi:two-component system, OmpR family, alkaline phosphatase synthesis response regulator PhoP